ncbi:hypothetical protein EON64_00680 [archaeon]|nr:MAG: hypothetical protein EON64_00680 [archaeon]
MVSSTYGYQGIFLSVLYLVKIASFSQQSTTAILSVSVSLYQSCNVISHFSPGHKKYISHMLRYPFDQHISDMEVKKLIEHFPSPCLDALSKFRNISYSATLPNGTVMTINSFDYVDANICSFSRSLTVEINNPISNLSYEESTEVYEVLSSIFKQSGDVSKFSHASVYSSGVAVEFFQSLQTRIEKFCIDVLNDIDILLCAQFKQRVFTNVLKQIKAHLLSLPSVQWQPSPQDAFVYLHIEKTGGTTLRE